MSRRHFIKMLLSMLTVIVASFVGLWKWFGRGIEVGESPNTPASSPTPPSVVPKSGIPAQVSNTEPLLLSFMILSDLHINSSFSEQSQKYQKALDDVMAFESKVEALVVTGDITDAGSQWDYEEYNRIMKDYKKLPQVHANMGNHDYYNIWLTNEGQWKQEAMPNGKTDGQTRKTFMTQFGLNQVYHDFHVNGYHVIMLSQETYVQEKPEVGEGAWYSDGQMAWFKQKMEEHKDGSPVFVMIHQPLPSIGQDGGSHSLIRAKEFRAILQPYSNVFVFSGHRHQNLRSGQHYVQETFHWFANASVGRTRGLQSSDPLTAQGLYLQVYADKVVLRGREFMDRTWIEQANWTIPLKPRKSV